MCKSASELLSLPIAMQMQKISASYLHFEHYNVATMGLKHMIITVIGSDPTHLIIHYVSLD